MHTLVCLFVRESIILCNKSFCQTGCAGAKSHSQSTFLLERTGVYSGRLPVRRQMQMVLGLAR